MSLFSRQKHAKQKGTALLELALVWPLLSLVLLGVIDFGRIFYASIEVTNAAHAGVQYGARSLTLANDTAGMQSAAINDAVEMCIRDRTWVRDFPFVENYNRRDRSSRLPMRYGNARRKLTRARYERKAFHLPTQLMTFN